MNLRRMSISRSLLRFPRILLILVAVMTTSISARAASNAPSVVPGFTPNGVYADFDGDLKPDLVQFQGSFLNIQRSDGSQLRFATSIESHAVGLQIAVAFLDNDDYLDIIVANRLFHQPAVIWINDGKGSFSESGLRTLPDSFGHRYWWSGTCEGETEELIDVERFESIVCLPSVELLSPSSSCFTWHEFSTRRALPGHDKATHLRGPPSTSCN